VSPLVKLQRVGASPEGTFMNKENSHEDTLQDIAVCNNTDLSALKNQVNHSETEASDESCGSHSDSSCGEDGDDRNHADDDGFRPDRPGIVPVEHPKDSPPKASADSKHTPIPGTADDAFSPFGTKLRFELYLLYVEFPSVPRGFYEKLFYILKDPRNPISDLQGLT